MALVVVLPFASYKRGDKITDAALILKILASSNAPKVVQIGPSPK
jgi:hypothetical protein